MALSDFMRPSLLKGADAVLSSDGWQEIRVGIDPVLSVKSAALWADRRQGLRIPHLAKKREIWDTP